LLFMATIVARKFAVPGYVLVVAFIATLLVAWRLVKTMQKPIPCSSCGADIRAVVLVQGKKAAKGYCSACGSEIT